MKIATSILIIALSVTLISAAIPRAYAQSPLDQVGGAIKGVLDWLWENIIKPIIDGIGYVCQGIVNAIRAPFDALVNVWNQWWYSLLGFGWYAPIIGMLVIAACIIIIAVLWKLQPYIF